MHSMRFTMGGSAASEAHRVATAASPCWATSGVDRKSTRLNSSHLVISYAVFCLKKKYLFVLIIFNTSVHLSYESFLNVFIVIFIRNNFTISTTLRGLSLFNSNILLSLLECMILL